MTVYVNAIMYYRVVDAVKARNIELERLILLNFHTFIGLLSQVGQCCAAVKVSRLGCYQC